MNFKILCYDARWDQTRCTSESAIDTFSTLSRHLVKNVFLQKPYLLEWISRYSLCYDARTGKTRRCAPESAIDTFSTLSRHLVKNVFFYKSHIFWNEFQDIHYVMTPEGGKPDATHPNPPSIRFPHYPDILSKNDFLQKPYLLEWVSKYSLCYDARREETRCCACESAIDTFSTLSRHLVKNVFL